MSVAPLRLPQSPAREPVRSPREPAVPLAASATLSEIFAGNGHDAAAAGFALAQIAGDKPLLWVQDRMSILQTGRPFPPAIGTELIHVEARDAKAALWAMEEGLRCSGLNAVIGEIWGSPAALDFTATRRLAVAAERSGVPAILLLFDSVPNLSGARMRWLAASRPSPAHPHDPFAPGAPAWSLDLFKARGGHPGRFEVTQGPRHETHGLRLLSAIGDGQSAQEKSRRRTG